jgi:hypothetical protein
MIDLEQQFELLMRMARKNVADKVDTGELTRDEGVALLDMIDERTDTHPDGWRASHADIC